MQSIAQPRLVWTGDSEDRSGRTGLLMRCSLRIGKPMLFALLHGRPNDLATTLKLVPLQVVLPLKCLTANPPLIRGMVSRV